MIQDDSSISKLLYNLHYIILSLISDSICWCFAVLSLFLWLPFQRFRVWFGSRPRPEELWSLNDLDWVLSRTSTPSGERLPQTIRIRRKRKHLAASWMFHDVPLRVCRLVDVCSMVCGLQQVGVACCSMSVGCCRSPSCWFLNPLRIIAAVIQNDSGLRISFSICNHIHGWMLRQNHTSTLVYSYSSCWSWHFIDTS